MKKLLAIVILAVSPVVVFAEELETYFAKEDVKALMKEDNEFYKTFRTGQPVKCAMKDGKCCFETEPGTVCVDASKLSREKKK